MATKTDTQGLVISTTSDFDIVMTRVFKAPARLVFDAWTTPEHVKRWFGPATGRWTSATSTCGWAGSTASTCGSAMAATADEYAHGEEMGIYGEYSEIDAPTHLANTEVFEEPYFEEMGAGTINTLDFNEKDGVTTQVGVSALQDEGSSATRAGDRAWRTAPPRASAAWTSCWHAA